MFTIVKPHEAKKKANCCLKLYFRNRLSHLKCAKLVRLLISSVGSTIEGPKDPEVLTSNLFQLTKLLTFFNRVYES